MAKKKRGFSQPPFLNSFANFPPPSPWIFSEGGKTKFESSVIFNGSQTFAGCTLLTTVFESSVIFNGSQTEICFVL